MTLLPSLLFINAAQSDVLNHFSSWSFATAAECVYMHAVFRISSDRDKGFIRKNVPMIVMTVFVKYVLLHVLLLAVLEETIGQILQRLSSSSLVSISFVFYFILFFCSPCLVWSRNCFPSFHIFFPVCSLHVSLCLLTIMQYETSSKLLG